MIGWLRPLRREAWRCVTDAHSWAAGIVRAFTDWRNWHRFMSTQALGLGTAALSVFITLGYSSTVLLVTLGLTVLMVLIGTLVRQEEVNDE